MWSISSIKLETAQRLEILLKVIHINLWTHHALVVSDPLYVKKNQVIL